MRTVVFILAMNVWEVAVALGAGPGLADGLAKPLAIIFMACVVMDIIEFFHKVSHRQS